MERNLIHPAGPAAQAEFYNRYLDIIDGKIEARFMETALREGCPPSKTGGIYRPLSDAFTGERRANIARIVAGGQFVAPQAIAETSNPTQPAPTAVA